MRRVLLGVISIASISAGVGLLVRHGVNGGQWSTVASVFLRVGFVLGAIWLAFPQVEELAQRIPPWLIGIVAASILTIAVAPKAFWIAGPVIAAMSVVHFIGWMFKPPARRKPRTKVGQSSKNSQSRGDK